VFPHDSSFTLAAEFNYFLSEYMKAVDSAQEELMTRRFNSRDEAEEALHFTLTHFAPCLCSVMYGTLHRKNGTYYRYLCPIATRRKHTNSRSEKAVESDEAEEQDQETSKDDDALIHRPCSYAMSNPDAMNEALKSRTQNDCHWVAILAFCRDDPTKFYFKRIDSVARHCALCITRRSYRVKRVIMKKIGDLCSAATDDESEPPTKKAKHRKE